jgi:DNA-directed RNA polymerase subunit E"
MAKEKACKQCKAIYEGEKCPNCGSEEFAEAHKGHISILKPDESDIAKNLKLAKKGNYAIKLG